MNTSDLPDLPVDPDFIRTTLERLVRIDSVNPRLVPGAAGEAEIAEYTAEVMADLGLDVARREPEPGRPSVIGRLSGSGDGPPLMLNAHYDTVGVEGMDAPFSAEVRDGRLYGRGAYDMKGSLAAILAAARALRVAEVDLAGDLLIAAVADEEHGSLGTRDIVGHLPVQAAVVTEPTDLDICIAHKGFLWMKIVTEGRAAHGSRPDLGIDANLAMGRVLAGLAELEERLAERDPHPLVGRPSLHAGTLQGGTGPSTYAARCELRIERRTVPGETEASALAEVAAILDRLRANRPRFRARLEPLLSRPPFETERDAPVVRSVAGCLRGLEDREPEYRGEMPWMDSALLADAGVDTVVIGPSGEGAHADVEWVDLDSLERLARILACTALRYCGAP